MARPHRKRRATAQLIIGGLFAAGIAAVVVLHVLPGPRPVREGARRMNCPSNLRQIALAAKQYAPDNGGVYPPDFSALLRDHIDTPKLFSCPSNPSAWDEIRTTGRVGRANTSYVYVSGLTPSDDPRCILAFDRPENHQGEGVNAVFLDTHVEWMPLEEFKKKLEETRRLARENGHEMRLVYE